MELIAACILAGLFIAALVATRDVSGLRDSHVEPTVLTKALRRQTSMWIAFLVALALGLAMVGYALLYIAFHFDG